MTTRRRFRGWAQRATAILTAFSVLELGLSVITARPASAAVGPRCLAAPAVLPIASGGYTNYSLDTTGSVWAWGANGVGEIGNGSFADVALPVNASGLSSVQAVAAGFGNVMVLRQDGTVWGWGNDQNGQLGDGRSGTGVFQPVPTQTPGLTGVVALATGQNDTFVFKADATVWGWGLNADGELGDGTTTDKTVPEQLTALTGFTAVAVGSAHTLGLKADGTVWAWGKNQYGEVGSGAAVGASQLTPIQVPGLPSGATGLAAGTYHSAAVTTSGQVWSWGYNVYGQLGDGTYNSTSTPVHALGVSGVTKLSAGDWFTLALTSGGAAYGWGDNYYSELGIGSTATPQGTPVSVSGISGVSALTAGDTTGMALTSDGRMWDWGNNDYGQAGNGTIDTTNPPVGQETPYQVSVAQSVPAVPKTLSAVAANTSAYLTWAAPTSAVTQYVVTPYLDGVAQPQVAAPVTAPPQGAPPGTTSSYTVSGLVQGGNYTFTVAAQNCLGTGGATAQSNSIVPAGPQIGDHSTKVESSQITDRMTVNVNAFNGNLGLSQHDLGIKGTGLDLSLDRTYNNKAASASIFGPGWASSVNPSLIIESDGSALFNGPSGSQVGYAKQSDGTFAAPSGADATLVKNGDGTYTLTAHGAGDAWKFTAAGVAASHTDRNGNTITFTHGGPGGALSSITDTQGRVTTLAYNASNLVSQITDPTGRLYQYGYDAGQNLTTYTDPANIVTSFAYDANHNLTQITTPAGRVVTFGFDSMQRTTSMGHPNQAGSPTTTFAYNPAGCAPGASCTAVTDANLHTTTYTFDPVGRTTQVIDGLGNKTAATYTSDSNVATYSGGNGTASGSLGYDSRNNLNTAGVATGSHSTLGYTDPNHPFSPTAVTDPQNNTTTLSYDTNGNPLTQTDPLASQNQVQLTYNANGTIATSTDPDGNKTTYGYDPKGNLTSVTAPTPLGSQTIVPDTLSRPSRIIDGNGRTTTYAYDTLDRVTLITYNDGKTVRYVYDGDGNPTSMTDSTGATTMTYDAMGRLKTRSTPDGNAIAYGFDGVGNLVTIADPGGTTTYTYSAANLPVTVVTPAHDTIVLGYDANYNRTTVAFHSRITTTNVYDSANRLVTTNTTNSRLATVFSDSRNYTPSGPAHASARSITMRGSPSTFGSNGTTAAAVTLAAPTGLAAGDVEVAQIASTGNATVSSVPAGWTQVRQDTSGGPSSDLLQGLYYHVATTSEPSVYSFGLSVGTQANGGLSAWTGVDTTAPVETSSARVNAAGSTTWTAPSVAYQNGELDLVAFGGRLSGGTSPLTVPANYTEPYDTQTGSVTVGLDTNTMGGTAGASGDQTVAGPSSRWVAQQMLLRPVYDSSLASQSGAAGTLGYDSVNRLTTTGSNYSYGYDGASNRLSETYLASQSVAYSYNGANQLTKVTKPVALHGRSTGTAGVAATSLSIAKPTGTTAGDLLVAQVDVTGAAALTAPTGWTTIDNTSNGIREALYWHVAGTTEPATYPWTFATGHVASGGIAAYGGVDTSTSPIDAWTVATGSGTSMAATGITTTVPNDQLIATFAAGAATAVTGPSGMTQQWSVPSGAGSIGTTSAMFDQVSQAAGGTGSRTATAATTSNWVAHLFAVRPATGYSYDGNGNSIGSSDGAAAAYDTANRATSITAAGGSAQTFTYRGASQAERATMTPALRVNAACTAIAGCPPQTTSLGTTATFENTLLGVSAETDGTSTTYFVRDPRGGILAQFTGQTIYYYTLDGSGSVVGLTNTSGGVVATYGYDPYGQLTAMTGGSVATNNPFRYIGAYQDGTGLYHMGARYYDPTTGRFTQQDQHTNPLDPKSWNRYTYSGSDPINFKDPSGMNGCGIFGSIGHSLAAGGAALLGGESLEGLSLGGLFDAAAVGVGGVVAGTILGVVIIAGTVVAVVVVATSDVGC